MQYPYNYHQKTIPAYYQGILMLKLFIELRHKIFRPAGDYFIQKGVGKLYPRIRQRALEIN